MKIWSCKIGEVDPSKVPPGGDSPMRRAVEIAYRELTGERPAFNFSGWGAELDEAERAVVENRSPRTPERELGGPCENCGQPVEPGQIVLPYDDVGEMHANCKAPFSLDYEHCEGNPDPVVLLGSPMRHVPLAALSGLVK